MPNHVTVRQAGWEDGREDESKPGDQPSVVCARSFDGESGEALAYAGFMSE